MECLGAGWLHWLLAVTAVAIVNGVSGIVHDAWVHNDLRRQLQAMQAQIDALREKRPEPPE